MTAGDGAAVDVDALVEKFAEDYAETLRGIFPHWRIYKASGQWWAMRSGENDFTVGPRSLICSVAGSGTVVGLAEQLSLQEHLRRLSPADLEAVWRGLLAGAAR